MATKKSQLKKKKPAVAKRAVKKATAKKPAARVRRARPSKPGKAGPVNEWTELRQSDIHGLGAFSRKEIPKYTRIIEYVGERISNSESDRRYDDAKMKRHHTFLFILNDRVCLDAAFEGNESRFLNHSCDPNCEAIITRGHIWIEAKRKIPADTELVYDYQFEDDPAYTQEDLKFYACKCGAPNCRGTIVKTKKKIRK
jgi:SET domain-containing protein